MDKTEYDRLAEKRSQNLRQLLVHAHRELNTLVATELVRRGYHDTRLIHSRLLENLDRSGNSITVVAKRAHMTKQAMGALAKELAGKGYLRRVVDKNDRRAWTLQFTAKGWRLMLETFEIIEEIEHALLTHVGPAQFDELRAGLAAMSRSAPRADDEKMPLPRPRLTANGAACRRRRSAAD